MHKRHTRVFRVLTSTRFRERNTLHTSAGVSPPDGCGAGGCRRSDIYRRGPRQPDAPPHVLHSDTDLGPIGDMDDPCVGEGGYADAMGGAGAR
jgi:hypothetical protein